MNESNRAVSGLWICPEGTGALSNLPESRRGEGGMEFCDAEEILPVDRIFTDRRNSFAQFADRFRWELMLRKGGWYVDMDEICIRPLDFAEDVVFGREDDDLIAVGALKFPAGHSVAEAMADACANPDAYDLGTPPGGVGARFTDRCDSGDARRSRGVGAKPGDPSDSPCC